MEANIARFASLHEFPILPCNLYSNQSNLQRPQIKLLLHAPQDLNPYAKQNVLNAMGNVQPSRLLDKKLRAACNIDPINGDED